jgi:hypothetical protein
MPSEEAGYTYAVEPAAIDRLLANEGESIYSRSNSIGQRLESTDTVEKLDNLDGRIPR